MLLGRFVDFMEHPFLYILLDYGVTFLVGLLVYFFGFVRYRRFLLARYGYGLTLGPTKLGVFGIGIFYAMQFLFGLNDLSFIPLDYAIFQPNLDHGLYELMVLSWALPGVLLETVWCLVKTKNPLIALINVPILFAYCFLCGYFIIFYVAALFLGVIGVGMFAGLAGGHGPKRGWQNRRREDRTSENINL